MFTGIVNGVATVLRVQDRAGLRTLTLGFPNGFGHGLEVGASVAVDGVCLTATQLNPGDVPETTQWEHGALASANFDVMQQSLALTSLGQLQAGSAVNVERAAKEGAEIGGHPLSGHVDCLGRIVQVRQPQNNHVLRIEIPPPFRRYVFAKGFIAINGCSLTAAEVDRQAGWLEVWLIPETLRMTTFAHKQVGDSLNIEIERQTQVFVDTVREAMEERLGPLIPALEQWLAERGSGIGLP